MPAQIKPHRAESLAVLLSGKARVARVLTHFRKSDNRTDAEIMGLLGLGANNLSTLNQIGYGSPKTGLGNDNLLRLAEVLGLGDFKPEFDMLLSGPGSYWSQREKGKMADPDFIARVDYLRDFADSLIEIVDGLPQKLAEQIEAHRADAVARLEEAREVENALNSLRASQRQYGKEPALFGPDAAYDRSVAESYVFAQTS